MKIGFLVIGSEVLDGKITEANLKILADYLRLEQLEVHKSLVARDDKASIESALSTLLSETDVIVTSGGLGPTKDDITKETLAGFFGKKILFSEEALKVSEANYARFGRPFPGKEHGYSYLPEGFIPLNNPTGFAPSFYALEKNKVLLSGPGVPREFKSMLEEHFLKTVSPLLEEKAFFEHFIVRTKNVPEEKIFKDVDPELWQKLEAFGDVSSLPILMGVDIGVKVRASTREELDSKLRELEMIFSRSPVRSHIWGRGRETLEERIIRIARDKKVTFGFAESATGGLCSHRITCVPGASAVFMGGIVSYDEKVKTRLLGVSKETLAHLGAVSEKCCQEMAGGAKENLNVDIAISITGIAGPGGGSDENPVGTIWIGRASQGFVTAEKLHLKGDREILKQRFSQAALYALLEEVEKIASP